MNSQPSPTAHKAPIPANVRVMIALVASPTLMVIGMLFYSLFVTGFRSISISMIIFSLLGFFAYYLVFTGRLPTILVKKPSQKLPPES